ncbi:MAG: hypothetical protein H6654_18600 [Ardenticatenaceae bacterium]|nr:hypothetical protein [Anaerolineales bacterium]MCB8937443.1 hypothetical protein [Ardenticatenaceae bacterium]MCB8975576.1 hypothetical protein [Ardenticatenaceae bacterium]
MNNASLPLPFSAKIDKVQLKNALMISFNKTELKGLCFDIDLDSEQLPDGNKELRVQELILLCQRLSKVENLLNRCAELRPEIPWQNYYSNDLQLSNSLLAYTQKIAKYYTDWHIPTELSSFID